MWENIVYTKAQAKHKFEQVAADPLNCAPNHVKEPFNHIRTLILQEREVFLQNSTNKIKSHSYDLQIGMLLYRTLNDEYRFNERAASRDEVWRYLSLEVCPDIVFERYDLNDLRFYRGTRRIWLRSIWWYVHLSWQGSEEATYDILKGNSADDILQLIDRSGSGGYRIELTRELMRQNKMYNNMPIPLLFRRVLKLNTARLNMIEPSLVEGGISSYVHSLYQYYIESYKKESSL